MLKKRSPAPLRQGGARLAQVISLPALLTIGLVLLVLAGLALLPTVVWQVNPLLWRQLLRLQGAFAGLLVGAALGFLVGRLTARRR